MASAITKRINVLLFVIASAHVSTALADFLEMPEIEQLRDAEEKTLLRDLDVPA